MTPGATATCVPPWSGRSTHHLRGASWDREVQPLQCSGSMTAPCRCDLPRHVPRRVVLTGGPGAGKTAVLEVVRQHFCEHVEVIPEAASILFRGGFPRRDTPAARRAAQRAIFRLQAELERMAMEESRAAVLLCDRGTVDGLAYWDDPPETFWADVGTNHAAELGHYAAVIHLRTPPADNGYDHSNPVRTESAAEALRLDERIFEVWRAHPARTVIASHETFLGKLGAAIEAIRREVPPCCRTHEVALRPAAVASHA
jgi:predicted ATPase